MVRGAKIFLSRDGDAQVTLKDQAILAMSYVDISDARLHEHLFWLLGIDPRGLLLVSDPDTITALPKEILLVLGTAVLPLELLVLFEKLE